MPFTSNIKWSRKIKHRQGLPDLEHKENSIFISTKTEYLMLSRIESGAKAFIVTIEVPIKIKQKKKKKTFRKRKTVKKPVGGYYLPFNYILIHSVNALLTV